jgi:SH3-like domain-containing protein
MKIFFVLIPIFILFSCCFPQEVCGSTLPLPRFASLRSDTVNLRTGPGLRYPIKWVLKRKNLPVVVKLERENWRFIELHDGTTGWVFQSMLSGKRFLVVKSDTPLLASAKPNSKRRAFVEKLVVGQLKGCIKGWCKVMLNGGYSGYMPELSLWGVDLTPRNE